MSASPLFLLHRKGAAPICLARSGQARRRCLGPEQARALEFGPERVGDVATHGGEIWAHLLGGDRSRDHRDDVGLPERKLQRAAASGTAWRRHTSATRCALAITSGWAG